jgi:hypothetical protein
MLALLEHKRFCRIDGLTWPQRDTARFDDNKVRRFGRCAGACQQSNTHEASAETLCENHGRSPLAC